MGDEDDGRPGPLPDLLDLLVHALAGHLVERTERFVHEQDRRFERECPGDSHALLHPARKLPGVMPGELPEVDEVEHLLGPCLALRLVGAHDLEREGHVLGDGPPLEQDRRLEDHPVVAIETRPGRGLAVDHDLASATAPRGRR